MCYRADVWVEFILIKNKIALYIILNTHLTLQTLLKNFNKLKTH